MPDAACDGVVRWLDHISRILVAARVSAHSITCACIALGTLAGVLLSLGDFSSAAVLMVVASLGDALDGLVARRSGRASVAGALLDASGDRYQEFFFLGGLAVYFRACLPALVMALFALAGSFMVSYSSAKAEALGGPVPPGVMRRAERAVCLCTAAAIATPWQWLVSRRALPAWVGAAPLLIAMGLIAVVANVSAVRRLFVLGRVLGRGRSVVDSRRVLKIAAPAAPLPASLSEAGRGWPSGPES